MKMRELKKLTAVVIAAAMLVPTFTAIAEENSEVAVVAVEEPAAPAVTEAPAEPAPVVTEAPAEPAPVVTEAPAEPAPVVTETPAVEEAVASIEEKAPAAAEEKKEELKEEKKEEYKTSFAFNNGEVSITATVSESAKLPMNAEMVAVKLQPGSGAYEAAKGAAMAGLGTGEGYYSFYDVVFMVNGNVVNVPDGAAVIQMSFVGVPEGNVQKAISVDNGGVFDVTASAGAGYVSSGSFQF